MDSKLVLQKYKEIDTEITVSDSDYTATFHAQGKNHSFFYVYNYDANDRFIAIGEREQSLKDVLVTGHRVSIGQQSTIDDGYKRTVMIERAMLENYPLTQAIQITESAKDYDALEKKLTELAAAPQTAARIPSPAP